MTVGISGATPVRSALSSSERSFRPRDRSSSRPFKSVLDPSIKDRQEARIVSLDGSYGSLPQYDTLFFRKMEQRVYLLSTNLQIAIITAIIEGFSQFFSRLKNNSLK